MCIAYEDGGFSKKNNTKTISLLSVNSKDKKIYFHTKTWMQMFIELLFIIAPKQKQSSVVYPHKEDYTMKKSQPLQ